MSGYPTNPLTPSDSPILPLLPQGNFAVSRMRRHMFMSARDLWAFIKAFTPVKI